ncbi:MAG: bifunctional folylpolyglutamate synthase/dihydrofolate synthase [Roseburia sp.]
MTYEEICDYIYAIPKFTKKNDLNHTRELLRRLHIMERRFEIIHVAGSNGKGSVCAYLHQVLKDAGLRVGMFTSPHLVCMEERFVVNGQRCSRAEFIESFEAVAEVVEQMEADGLAHPSFFEYLFAMGMYYFQKKQVRYLILETGLGGRLDATNVFDEPMLTIITSISLEHTEYLGDTISAIAAEKAGIIKEGIPVIFDASNPEANRVITETAKRNRAPYYPISLESLKFHGITGKNIDFSYVSGYDVVDLSIPFAASYQMMNAALAYRALTMLMTDLRMDRRMIAESMAKTGWPGRMQMVAPGVYFDGAHNADGIRQFIQSVQLLQAKKPILLFSMMREKDYHLSIQALCRQVEWDQVIVTHIDDERGLEPAVMEREFLAAGQQVTVKENSTQAYAYGLGQKKEGQMLFCAGSLYLIGELEAAMDCVKEGC